MIDIVIKDKVSNKNVQVEFCSSWNEIPLKNLLFIGEYWMTWRELIKGNVSLLRTKALLFVRLANSKELNKRNLVRTILKSDNETMWELSELTNFIFTKNDLTKNPLPVVKGWFRNLHSPSEQMKNILAFEFIFADTFYLQYMNNKKEDSLDKFLGALYRPKKLFSNTRVNFDKDKIERYAKRMAKLKYAEKQIILLWYIGCREAIINDNINLFGGKKTSDNSSWIDVVLEMSGNKFGNFQQTGRSEFFLLLRELQLSNRKKPKLKNEHSAA